MDNTEVKKLKDTLTIIKNLLEEEKQSQGSIRRIYKNDPINMDRALRDSANRLRKLSQSIDKPYFGRVVFDDHTKIHDVYIGKNAILDGERIIVTDWRAPISTLYYDSNIGPTSYIAPNGTIHGDLQLKRQYNIENSQLIDYYDVDIVSNDQLLQNYLNTNNDKRLKNIVSTIQSEQNYIIRRPLTENNIIQGVAGSGKTTVALHRIAYLEYNYRNSISADQYLVIGPNTVFMDYIKAVLPDLDVNDVNQYTIEDLTRRILDEGIEFTSINKKLNNKISGKDLTTIDKFKGSLIYKQMLEKYMKDLIKKTIQGGDLDIDEFCIIPQNVILDNFKISYQSYPNIVSAVNKTILYLMTYVENNRTAYKQAFNKRKLDLLDMNKGNQQETLKIRKRFERLDTKLNQKFKNEITRYFRPLTKKVTALYADFIKDIKKYNFSNYQEIEDLKKLTNTNIKNKVYDFEDIAALLYIASQTTDLKEYNNIRHIVIDEAQDFSLFNFDVLKTIFSNATFSIYGDLAQSIYNYRSIDHWDELSQIFPDIKQINLNKSYRTTDEIMKTADLVAKHIGMNQSEDVIRHGNHVEFHNYDMVNAPQHIKEKIEEYREKGYKSIAIISKNDLLTNYINDDLSFIGVQAQNITSTSNDYDIKNDVITISNAIAKGLEFDAVILNNASEDVYNSDNDLDMKLLYVALTRALHEVDVVYDKELTKPLQVVANKEESHVKPKVKEINK